MELSLKSCHEHAGQTNKVFLFLEDKYSDKFRFKWKNLHCWCTPQPICDSV